MSGALIGYPAVGLIRSTAPRAPSAAAIVDYSRGLCGAGHPAGSSSPRLTAARPHRSHNDNHPSEWKVEGRHRSEEHTSELQSLMRISYAVFCLNKTNHLKSYRCTNTPRINTMQ